MTKKKRRWCVVWLKDFKFSAAPGGKIAWETSLKEVSRLARATGGTVCDADWLARNWPEVRKTGAIPREATPDASTI